MDDHRHILLTGVAGFIGMNLALALLKKGIHVLGIDNLNSYYDITLKKARLRQLQVYKNFTFKQADITDQASCRKIWDESPDIHTIIHLAAQPGVRFSLEDPHAYIKANITGHLEMLELARRRKGFKHFIYASSSSVYGINTQLPFHPKDRTDQPISLYAATKKADEVMTESYTHLFGFRATGLRFFTVYGPWGRPDMAIYKFANKIMRDIPIPVYNQGQLKRDFTYIDDIVQGVCATLETCYNGHHIYNLGKGRSDPLMAYIKCLENGLNKKAIIEFQEMQPGDVYETFADIEDTQNKLGYAPNTPIEEGVQKFCDWFKSYHAHALWKPQ